MVAREISGITSNFLYEVEKASGEKVSACYQCKKCSSGCPVTFAMDFLPHVILRMIQLGLKERVLKSSTIWVCASCETCTTRCPNEIDLSKVMDSLGQMAVKLGVAPKEKSIPQFHSVFLTSIKKSGRVHEFGMTAQYIFRSGDFWTSVKSGEFSKEARLGWELFKRGKFKLLPPKIHGTKEIKNIFKQIEK